MQKLIAISVLFCVGGLAAQEPEAGQAPDPAMMEAWHKAATPGPEHKTLAKSAGTWKLTIKSWMAPDADPMVSHGTSIRTMILDGRVLKEEFISSMMGEKFVGQGHTGYDNVTGEYWSTWTDTMSTGLAHSTGQWKEGKGVFNGKMADPIAGGEVEFKSVFHRQDDDKEMMEMFTPGPDGKMMKSMEIVYVRE